ncbi:amidase [Spirochaetia bacterium]|nr:amidase [Spirochaetia bacterium]
MNLQEIYLTKNPYSRPDKRLTAVKGIVIHWVANPGSSAMQNRNYFDNLRFQSTTYASAHFLIGLEGEVIQCLLENEVGYHVGANRYSDLALKNLSSYPNNCTLGIELCHPDWTGKFTGETLQSAKELVLELCERYNLSRKDLYRHYDITGKDCPRWFVQNPDKWEEFLGGFPAV